MIGKLPAAKGGYTYAVVCVDYFTKWAVAEPLIKITGNKIRDFFYTQIICRFGVPYLLVADNGTQFESPKMAGLCEDLGIKLNHVAVYHPKANGQVEATNKLIKKDVKKRIKGKKGNWAEELPSVLWAYNTTPRVTTGETPFSLTYGFEAVIPIEVDTPTFRTERFEEEVNEEAMRIHLDMIEERRAQAQMRVMVYQERVKKCYDKKVIPKVFKKGDLVLKKITPADHTALGPNWEGPYKIHEALGKGTYRIINMTGKEPLPRTYNAENLRFYYR